ncbi:hypothetical protein [Elizabethkingia phage TCUEAP1]|nr:hypothetical protein [Elizabethkingia phage TCUEAP1]
MNTEIFLNGVRLDTTADTKIRFTFQVNDIADVKDRQASYSNQFSLPMTPRNVQALDGLGLPSSGSRIPYTKPNSQLKIEGLDLINRGWLNVQESGSGSYSAYIYSGIINFFKAIENRTFADLDLSALNHNKTVRNVAESMSVGSTKAYSYLIADYNGDLMKPDGSINVDYLVPAVPISYLWRKIHERYNIAFDGSVFDRPDFKSLYMTYPKAINPTDRLKAVFRGTVKDFIGNRGPIVGHYVDNVIVYDPYEVTNGQLIDYRGTLPSPVGENVKGFYRFPKAGEYKVRYKGKVKVKDRYVNQPTPAGFLQIWYTMNHIGKSPFELSQNSNFIARNERGANNIDVNFERQIFVNEGDTIVFGMYDRDGENYQGFENLTVEIDAVEDDSIDFTSELRDISIKEFVKDVLNLFSLTPFTNEFTTDVHYRTLSERVHNANVVDWSDKYINRTKERYVFSTYAQRNYFRYKYNDREGNYNDGYMFINNVNLQESKDVFTSMFYSPENGSSALKMKDGQIIAAPVYKMWDRETDKDGKVKYKPLDKRFYLAKREQSEIAATLVSDNDRDVINVTSVRLGKFDGLNMFDIVNNNYTDFVNIAGDSKIQTIQLDLDVQDILNLDLDRLYYFAQEQQYYLLNKLEVQDNNASGEFVRVRPVIPQGEHVDESKMVAQWDPESGLDESFGRDYGRVRAIIYGDPLGGIWQQRVEGGAWNSKGTVDGSNYFNITFAAGLNEVRIQYETLQGMQYSNIVMYRRSNVTDKCYSFVLENQTGAAKTFYVKYIDTNGNNKTIAVALAPMERTTITGKDMLDTDGATQLSRTQIDCPR